MLSFDGCRAYGVHLVPFDGFSKICVPRRSGWHVILLSLLLISGEAARAAGAPPEHPARHEAVAHDVSPPLREIPPLRPAPGPRIHEHEILPTPRGTGAADSVVQTETSLSAAAPNLLSTFEGGGLGIAAYTVDAAPPDTNGDVGPNHYVQWLNEEFTVFSKAGAILYGPAAGLPESRGIALT